MKKFTKLFSLTFVAIFAVTFFIACNRRGQIDERLVGQWEWNQMSSFQLILEADGSGRWLGVEDPMIWEVNGNELIIYAPNRLSRSSWYFEINADILRIERSDGVNDSYFCYNRR